MPDTQDDYLTIRIKGKRNEIISLGKEQKITSKTTVKELRNKIAQKAGEAEKILFSGYELTSSGYDHKTLD